MEKYYARLNLENYVIDVIVATEEGLEQLKASRPAEEFTYVETSRDGSFRRYAASKGFKYDEEADAFIPPKPYNSWVLNNETLTWEAPIAKPTDGAYVWDEPTGTWVPYGI